MVRITVTSQAFVTLSAHELLPDSVVHSSLCWLRNRYGKDQTRKAPCDDHNEWRLARAQCACCCCDDISQPQSKNILEFGILEMDLVFDFTDVYAATPYVAVY